MGNTNKTSEPNETRSADSAIKDKVAVVKAAVEPAVKKKRAAQGKKTAAKSAASKHGKTTARNKPAKTRSAASPAKGSKAKTAKAPVISTEEIALRAYYIAEKRQKLGLPGDSANDWIEAERQLRAEASPGK